MDFIYKTRDNFYIAKRLESDTRTAGSGKTLLEAMVNLWKGLNRPNPFPFPVKPYLTFNRLLREWVSVSDVAEHILYGEPPPDTLEQEYARYLLGEV